MDVYLLNSRHLFLLNAPCIIVVQTAAHSCFVVLFFCLTDNNWWKEGYVGFAQLDVDFASRPLWVAAFSCMLETGDAPGLNWKPLTITCKKYGSHTPEQAPFLDY
jgi:hypothetical protein